jgi:hypothetical protein
VTFALGILTLAPATGWTQSFVATASASLPDAPVPVATGQAQASARQNTVSPFAKTVDPGEVAPRLTVGDKVLLGLRSSVSPLAVTGWVAESLVSQARGGIPNYPGTLGGYGQRLGAEAARATSDTVLTDSVLSAALREDPRYYRMGAGHSGLKREVYAIGRVLFTRTDGGRRTLNVALLAGDVAGASLTQLYYPHINRGVGDVARTYGDSLIGAAVGFSFREFLGGWLERLHDGGQ